MKVAVTGGTGFIGSRIQLERLRYLKRAGVGAIATVLELPNCHVEAPTCEQALEDLKKQVVARLEKAEILSLEVQNSPSKCPKIPG